MTLDVDKLLASGVIEGPFKRVKTCSIFTRFIRWVQSKRG